MLNLIPALILLLVNGPTAPLTDNALLGTSVSVHRQVDADAQSVLLRLAFSTLSSGDTAVAPFVAPEDGSPSRPSGIPADPCGDSDKGFLSPGRTRDGPVEHASDPRRP